MSTVKLEGLHRDGPDWKCKCPAHQDNKASLAIKIAADGKLLLHCHAGCATGDIVNKWGVSWSVLFPEQPEPNGIPEQPEQIYDYTDEEGNLLFQVCRFPGKRFRQRRPLPGGEWAWNLHHTRRVLYRLPEIRTAAPDTWVFITEGEKDADRLHELGLVATTVPGGAGKWKQEYAGLLRDHKVAIVPDNDAPGEAHAQEVAQSLAGIAGQVKILELKGVPEKGDVSDWLESPEHTPAKLLELAEVSVSVPVYIEPERKQKLGGLVMVAAREFLAEEDVEPPDLVAGLLPEAGLSVIGAKPKVGKSTVVRCLCVAVVKGQEFLGRAVRQGPVIYLALEEKRREVREHFRRLGLETEDNLWVHFGASPEDGLGALAAAMKEIKPVLVVIDPLFRFVSVRDISDYAGVIKALGPVLEVARVTGAHLMLVHHNTKVEREGADDLLGSTGIFAAVDTAIIMRRRSDNSRYAYSVQRYGTDMEPTVLTMTELGQILAAASLEGYETQKAAEAILELLETDSQEVSRAEGECEGLAELEITERVGLRKQRVIRALKELESIGRISKCGSGRRGDPFKFAIPAHRRFGTEGKEETKE